MNEWQDPARQQWLGQNVGAPSPAPMETEPGEPDGTASARHAHVLGREIPRQRDYRDLSDPAAPSMDDHPADMGWGDVRFSLRQIPLEAIVGGWERSGRCPGGRHGAHCYAADQYERGTHDVAEPEYDEHGNVVSDDAQYVRRLAANASSLPPLVVGPNGGNHGGAHRAAAWREAGYTHIPAWVPDHLAALHAISLAEGVQVELDRGSLSTTDQLHRLRLRMGQAALINREAGQ